MDNPFVLPPRNLGRQIEDFTAFSQVALPLDLEAQWREGLLRPTYRL